MILDIRTGMITIFLRSAGTERKNKIEQGASIVNEVSEGKVPPIWKKSKDIAITTKNIAILSGIPKYQRFDLFFISDTKRREPKREIMPKNSAIIQDKKLLRGERKSTAYATQI